jgi:hypothetical protein
VLLTCAYVPSIKKCGNPGREALVPMDAADDRPPGRELP